MARVERHEEELEFTLKCTGLSGNDLGEIYQALAKKFPGNRVAFRNPFPPDFDPKTVHEILVMIRDSATVGYVGKKLFDTALDIIGVVVKKKLEKSPDEADHRKTVSVLGPDGKVASKIIAEPEPKPKKLKR